MELSDKAHFTEIRRLSTQIWTWAGKTNTHEIEYACEAVNLGYAKGKRKHLQRLQGKVFMRSLADANTVTIGPAIIPRFDDLADHISGSVFCIRDKRAPGLYWVKPDVSPNNPGKKPVQPSTDLRSRFKIEISEQHTPGTLMVEDDDVKIFLVHDGVDYLIKRTKQGQLITNEEDEPFVFRFGSLLSGGFVLDYGGREKYIWYIASDEKSPVSGESWELC